MHKAPKRDLNPQLVLGTPHWYIIFQLHNKLTRAGMCGLVTTSMVLGLGTLSVYLCCGKHGMGISRPEL